MRCKVIVLVCRPSGPGRIGGRDELEDRSTNPHLSGASRLRPLGFPRCAGVLREAARSESWQTVDMHQDTDPDHASAESLAARTPPSSASGRAPGHRPVGTGIALMVVAIFCLSVNDALAKQLTGFYPPVQVLFLRNLIALPFAIAIAWKLGGRSALHSYRPLTHLVRGVIWLIAATLFFTGLKHLELAEATALVFVAPVFVTSISALFLGETVGWRRWLAVLVGFIGALVVIRPGTETFRLESLYPLGTALFYAALMVGARFVDPRESVWTLMVWLVGAGALLSGLLQPFVWTAIDPGDLWLFAAIALFGTTGMVMMTQAFRFAPASVVAPFDYTALLWATLFGWVFWKEVPDAVTWIGAAIIVVSGLYIVLREGRTAD